MPWHGWILGALFLLYGLAAAADHAMSLAMGGAYFRSSGMTDAQVDYFSSQPGWALAAWTLSVWGSLLGAIALLMRRSLAAWLFAASVAGSLAYILYTFALSAGREAMGVLWAMPLVLAALTCAMVAYARNLARDDVLR